MSESIVAPNTAEFSVIEVTVDADIEGAPAGEVTTLPEAGVVIFTEVAPVLDNTMLFELYTPATGAVDDNLMLNLPLTVPSFSFFEADNSHTDKILNMVNGSNYEGTKVNIEVTKKKAEPRREGGSSRGGYGGGDRASFGGERKFGGPRSSGGERRGSFGSDRSGSGERGSRSGRGGSGYSSSYNKNN